MRLTEAQQRALLAICDAGESGLTPAEIGAALHPESKRAFARAIGDRLVSPLTAQKLVRWTVPTNRYAAVFKGRALAKKLREEG